MKKCIVSFLLMVLSSSLLPAQNTPRLVLPVGHIRSINSAVFSPNEKFILTIAKSENTARLWDASSGRELQVFNNAGGSAEFSPDGKQIITTRFDRQELYASRFATIWDVASAEKVKTLDGHSSTVTYANFSPDGKFVLTTSTDSTAIVWDAIAGTKLRSLKGHSSALAYGCFSPDGKQIITTSWDKTIRKWDTKSGNLLQVFSGHKGVPFKAAFSPDGKKLISGSRDSTVIIWDAATGNIIRQLPQGAFYFEDVSFSPDGLQFLTTEADGPTRLCESSSGKVLRDFPGNYNSALFSHDGKRILLSVNYKDTSTVMARIINAATGNFMYSLKGKFLSLSGPPEFLQKGNQIYSLKYDKTDKFPLKIWDFETGRAVKNYPAHKNRILSVHFNHEKNVFVSAGYDSTVRIREVSTGKELHFLKTHGASLIYSARFSPDGNRILTSDHDSTDRLWDVISGKEISVFRGEKWHRFTHFSPDGKRLLTGRQNSGNSAFTVSVRDLTSGNRLLLLHGFRNISWTGFSPDGERIILSGDSSTRFYDAQTGKELLNLRKSGAIPLFSNSVFSSDGSRMVIPCNDTLTCIWNVKTGELIRRLKGHSEPLYRAVFSPDDTRLVTSSRDNSIIIWDAETGKIIRRLRGFSNPPSISFHKDGKYFITANSTDQTILWETATGRRLYTRLQLNGDDYLVYDEHYRFDGTPGAMEKLYFACGLETTELGQMKDALYVPGLAEKIIRGEEIHYKKLSDLDFCNALPLLDLQKEDPAGREFRIQQRRWPLKQLDIKVGGKTVRSIPAEKLGLKDNWAILRLSNAEMDKYLMPFVDNEVELLAISLDKGSEFQSQKLHFTLPGPKIKAQPKLYMLLIGVNDYKDDQLNLRFPVQDARALGNALEQSAGKLLGKENVEVYHVQTRLPGLQVYTTPERAGVMKALEEIGRKARTQDVLFIFFAGHGVMQTEGEKAFTFLTADASRLNQVGISTKDLKEWLSPEGPFAMMPNKTILVYDACNSGQAAKELVSALTRDNDATERIRQVQDLGYKSGLFILSASAPDKPAYETPRLGQGLLTYSLLSTMKNNPMVLDESADGGGYLNLQKWFLETEREQDRILSTMGLKQKAQPYGSANIRIGVVDEEVRSGIHLTDEKPLVVCANARDDNDEDPLDLKNKVNDYLEHALARGIQSDVVFVAGEIPQANVVKIIYRMQGERVSCRLLIFKNKVKIQEQSLEATEPELVKSIVKELERACK